MLPHEQSLRGLLESAKDFLAGAKMPEGPFDPAGAWKQRYTVWLTNRKDGQAGTLELQRLPGGNGGFDLRADWRVKQSLSGVHQVQATIQCTDNDLATPRSWRCSSQFLRPSGEPIEELTVRQEASAQDGVVQLSGGRRLFADRPMKAWTSNWTLLAAVQRMGGRDIQPLEFTMLEFLDARKDGQKLTCKGWAQAQIGGKAVRLCGYQQVGQGILPYEYWLDEHSRLVAARTSLQGFLAVEEGAQ